MVNKYIIPIAIIVCSSVVCYELFDMFIING